MTIAVRRSGGCVVLSLLLVLVLMSPTTIHVSSFSFFPGSSRISTSKSRESAKFKRGQLHRFALVSPRDQAEKKQGVSPSDAYSVVGSSGSDDAKGTWNRRDVLRQSAAVSLASTCLVQPLSVAAADTEIIVAPPTNDSRLRTPAPLAASWGAVDGLNSMVTASSSSSFVAFDASAYKAMVNDKSRTPQFQRAIEKRIQNAPGGPSSVSVLDLGTGPFALLAVMAAEAGAGHVYAVEADPAAAQSARDTVTRSGWADRITILEGFSTKLNLDTPDGKVDLVLAEIVGSIATEEGAYASILDASRRFVREPNLPSSWIPNRIQTYASPASYLLHNVLGPPDFDWAKLGGEPVRFNCRDDSLQLLASPVLLEDVKFYELGNGPKGTEAQPGPGGGRTKTTFVVDADRIADNEELLLAEVKRNAPKMPADTARSVARGASRSVSGVALWPRLILDDETIVNSRTYPTGGQKKSHWQTVLPIMTARPVLGVVGGDKIQVEATFDFTSSASVNMAPKYRIVGQVIPDGV
jgi:hypothetical protein